VVAELLVVAVVVLEVAVPSSPRWRCGAAAAIADFFVYVPNREAATRG
jgi:hypothetical protein